MDWLQQILNGTPDEDALEHLRRGFNTWLRSTSRGRSSDGERAGRASHIALACCLGLPASPERVRMTIRDSYLHDAGQLLRKEQTKPKPYAIAVLLHREAQQFAGHQWLCWKAYDSPPPQASDLHRLLFLATKAGGGRLPGVARQFLRILQR